MEKAGPKLVRLGARSWVALMHVRVGVWAPEAPGGKVFLVDVGIDDDAAKKLARLLDENGFRPAALLLTHHHADHTGGAAWFKKNYQCHLFASEQERAFIESPVLEPFYLFGAYPPPALRNRFLEARPCEVDAPVAVTATGEPGALVELGAEEGLFDALRFMSLPGHSPGQLGLLTPDGVLFAGDAFFGADVLAKYTIPYHADVTRALASIDFLIQALSTNGARPPFTYLVPAHGDPLVAAEALPVLEENRSRLLELEDVLLRALQDGQKTREALLGELVATFPTELNSSQYHLLYSGVGALLADLLAKRRVRMRFTDRELLWERVD